MNEENKRWWIVPMISILSVLLGAVVGYFTSIKEKRASLLDDAKRQAYLHILESVQEPSELIAVDSERTRIAKEAAEADRVGHRKKRDDLQRQIHELDSKIVQLNAEWNRQSRIAGYELAIYGDRGVVKELADWDRREKRNPARCGATWKRDVQIYQEMRQSLMPHRQAVSDEDLADVIMKCTAGD